MSSCKAAATREAILFATSIKESREASPARLRIAEVDEYLGEIADELSRASLEIDWEEIRMAEAASDSGEAAAVAELGPEASPEGEPMEAVFPATPKELDHEYDIPIYDGFCPFLVHSVAPNASTPGDDCADLTTRLLMEAEKPEQIVAVLAHEFGHIREFHVVKQIHERKNTEVGVGLVALAGAYVDARAAASNPYYRPTTNWGEFYVKIMATYRPWDKNDEYEADLRGLHLFLHLGYDPADYISLFELFGEWGDAESETHPRTSERIARLDAALSNLDLPEEYMHRDLQQFRRLQALVADELSRLNQVGFLVSIEDHTADRKSQGLSVVPVSACGPLDYDFEAMDRSFWNLVTARSGCSDQVPPDR